MRPTVESEAIPSPEGRTLGPVVVVWPHGTEVENDAPLTVDIEEVGIAEIGDEVQAVGGSSRRLLVGRRLGQSLASTSQTHAWTTRCGSPTEARPLAAIPGPA